MTLLHVKGDDFSRNDEPTSNSNNSSAPSGDVTGAKYICAPDVENVCLIKDVVFKNNEGESTERTGEERW